MFFPNEKIKISYGSDGEDAKTVETVYDGETVSVNAVIDGLSRGYSESAAPDKAELITARLIFRALSEITGYTPPWGVLTGVRPSKLMLRLISLYGREGAEAYFRDDLLVSPRKTELAVTVAANEQKIISLSRPESFSLYISIPFCPSRCSYCSFVSHSITSPNAKKLYPGYISRLADEIALTGGYAKKNGLRLESVYFGGGTPGILGAQDLDRLQTAIEENFVTGSLREYTVEMGRPDTITAEKLEMLRLHGVDRISINPQTFNRKTLEAIGRKHTEEQAVEAYRLARTFDFRCINMDLIAGLPGETADDFRLSLETALELSPENITVHSLALKRSSSLNQSGARVESGIEAGKMLDYSYGALTGAGYIPYYMYRQSKCVGNLENTGWCKPGTEGLYNVYMMEECHTVLAAGAGGVTKLCEPGGTYVERIFNYKYPYEYISGFDEIIRRKAGIDEFYSRKGVK